MFPLEYCSLIKLANHYVRLELSVFAKIITLNQIFISLIAMLKKFDVLMLSLRSDYKDKIYVLSWLRLDIKLVLLPTSLIFAQLAKS